MALVSDLLTLPFTLGPGLAAWTTVAVIVKRAWNHPCFALCVAAAPLAGFGAFLATVFVLRLFVPRMRKGVYRAGLNRGMLSWYLTLALNRSAYVAGLKPLIQSFHLTKWLYWRAMGARIAFNVSSSIGATFVDLPLISIGAGSTISEYTHISAHTFVGDRLFLSPIEIGRNCFVGMNVIVGAGTRLKDGCWIGMHNKLINTDTLEAGTKLRNFEWEHGNPARSSQESKPREE